MRLITSAYRLARSGLVAGAAAILAATPVASVGTTSTGPSSSESPYVVPLVDGVETRSILSVGDDVGGYRLVGIPDGLGVLGTDDGAFRLFVNHELFPDVGIGRAHGGTGGAFVSDYTVDSTTLEVRKGSRSRRRARGSGTTPRTPTNSAPGVPRTSAGSVPPTWPRSPRSGIPDSRTGYNGRIFLTGEEVAEGRAFAHLVTGREHGTALGAARPRELRLGERTGGTRRRTAHRGGRYRRREPRGEVYVYVGAKQRARHADRARRPERGVAVRDQGRGRSATRAERWASTPRVSPSRSTASGT